MNGLKAFMMFVLSVILGIALEYPSPGAGSIASVSVCGAFIYNAILNQGDK